MTTEHRGDVYSDDDVRRLLRSLRAAHRRLLGDYRTAYRIVCSLCSVQRSQPYYNESQSWREAASWPCDAVVTIDTALLHLGVPLPEDRIDQIARNLEKSPQ